MTPHTPIDDAASAAGAAAPAQSASRVWLIRLAKLAVFGVVFACLYFAIRHDLSKPDVKSWRQTEVRWPLMAAAGLCLAGMNTVQMVRYRSLLFAYGSAPTWRQMAAIAWIPPLGKYVPGSIWSLMGAIAMLRRFGTNAAVAISVVVMVDAFSQIIGMMISAPLLMRPPLGDVIPAGRWVAPVVIALGVITLAPPVFGRLVQWGLRVIKRPPLERMPTWGEYVIPVASAVAQWVFAGAALWLSARALTSVHVSQLPWMIMIAACAMSMGYFAFITPAGMGIRELIFVALLPPLLPDAPAGTVTVVTVSMRLLQIAVELVLAALGGWMLRVEQRAGQTADATPDAVDVT